MRWIGHVAVATVSLWSLGGETRAVAAQDASSAAQASGADLAERILGARLKVDAGKVIVTEVKRGGTADRSGVRPGDQVDSIEKHKVASLDDVAKVLSHFKPGDGVVMTVIPKAGPRQLYIAPPIEQAAPVQPGNAMLGANLNDAARVVTVGEISMGGPAVVAGLRSGDQIVAIDGQAITSKAQVLKIVASHHPGNRITITIKRAGWQRGLIVRLAPRDQVAALPKLWVPSPQASQQPPGAPSESVHVVDPNDEWADAKEAEDIYNVNDRALYTDFD
ncbi:MAG: PDZ domain-containing protein [Singulisphaera sp.]